jgi:hypothetical protein
MGGFGPIKELGFFFCNAEDGTLGFAYAKQGLLPPSYIPSLEFGIYLRSNRESRKSFKQEAPSFLF